MARAKPVEAPAPKTIDLPDSLSNDERRYLHDVVENATARLAEQKLAPTPRAVHVKPKYETIESKTYDPGRATVGTGFEAVLPEPAGVEMVEQKDGPVEVPYWHLSETRQTNRPLACPDCGRGLQAGDGAPFDYLLCPAVPLGKPMPVGVPCDEGCVAACGRGAK